MSLHVEWFNPHDQSKNTLFLLSYIFGDDTFVGGDDICVFDALVWLNYLGMIWLNDFWIYTSHLFRLGLVWDSQSQKNPKMSCDPGGAKVASFTAGWGVFGR